MYYAELCLIFYSSKGGGNTFSFLSCFHYSLYFSRTTSSLISSSRRKDSAKKLRTHTRQRKWHRTRLLNDRIYTKQYFASKRLPTNISAAQFLLPSLIILNHYLIFNFMLFATSFSILTTIRIA